jgi:hypothetical protein
MADSEWDAIAPYLGIPGTTLPARPRRGRPMQDPRARLDAIVRATTLKLDGSRAPSRILPEGFGKADAAFG